MNQIFVISTRIARAMNVPYNINGVITKESDKAVYVKGNGIIPKDGRCARCGRKLTHPGSKLLGIGPECLGSWVTRDVILETLTEDQVKTIRDEVEAVKVDQWIPKSIIKNFAEIDFSKKVVEDGKTVVKEVFKKVSLVRSAKDDMNYLKIEFSFDRETLQNVKTLPIRKYSPENKAWYAPANTKILDMLKGFGFDILFSIN
ncbi:MAG: DUF6011 domain-containing protein [Candidatus Nanoarchaeia archaeon]|nr:DUF6011 domain-containing protein [Candidatus Nanoarchaeia archaeon]